MQDVFNEIYDTPPELLKRLAEASSAKPDLKVLDLKKDSGAKK
jgi:hypothetical protein